MESDTTRAPGSQRLRFGPFEADLGTAELWRDDELVALGGKPFEVLAEISLRLKAAHPNAFLLSCCGGYQGYLPLAYEYDRGGYEASAASTHFAPGTADRLLEAIITHPVWG